MSSNMQNSKEKVDHRLGLTAFIYFLILLPSSFMPEENVLFWFAINSAFSLVILVVLFILWKRHQHDSVRYYSLQVYAMLMGIVFFGITPLLKLLSGSMYFWLLLIFIGIVLFISHVMKKRIAKSFVDKKHKLLLTIMSLYVMVLIIVGIVLMHLMRSNESTENTGVSILFFLASYLFMVMSPAFLVREKDVEEMKE